jgi:hypothetical protein
VPSHQKQDNLMVVYIAGYGRSGSTILDIVLGNHPKVASLGEVGEFWGTYHATSSHCSCNRSYQGCAFWSQVGSKAFPGSSAETFASYRAIARRLEGWRGLLHLLGKHKARAEKQIYARITKTLFSTVCGVSGKNILVDSSKTAYAFSWRALALQRLCGLDVRLVHLVRDGRGVIASSLVGSNRKLLQGLNARVAHAPYRALFGWVAANFFAMILRLLFPRSSYHLMRYEALITDPETELARLGRFLGLDLNLLADCIIREKEFGVGHLMAGNRLARAGKVRVQGRPSPFKGLTRKHLLAYALCSWPVRVYTALVER